VVVTDNIVNRGAHIGLSVSNTPVKNNVFWGYNTVRDCIQFGAQLQGETGGIARHYFYRCFGDGIPEVKPVPQHTFEKPGKYRVTLIVWDSAGRGGRAERTIQVLPKACPD